MVTIQENDTFEPTTENLQADASRMKDAVVEVGRSIDILTYMINRYKGTKYSTYTWIYSNSFKTLSNSCIDIMAILEKRLDTVESKK